MQVYKFTLLLALAPVLPAQKFYRDDPLQAEPKPHPVDSLKARKLSDYYDFLNHQFALPGERQPQNGVLIQAQGVNTLGEPLQGAWWTKRHYYQRMTSEQLRLGAASGAPTTPSDRGTWTIVSAKNEGVTPGFTILDAEKRRFFIKFDPKSNPEMATAAEAISSRFFYAMGFHVAENNVITFDAERLEIGPGVKIAGPDGKKHSMTQRDLNALLAKAPKHDGNRYRAIASLAIPGQPIGPPRYYGTRADDPNDIVSHEHRRDLRALHVIDAWLGHDDSRAINNLDVVVTEEAGKYVRHYHLDFGATLGSASDRANSPRNGSYLFSWKAAGLQLTTLGLAPPRWSSAHYPDLPSVGKLEWKTFDPELWLPEYPNPAFLNRLPDDEFWGAKLVTAFNNADIRAIVSTGQLSDKRAEEWLIECLVQRRDKIGRTYFAKLLPLDGFEIRDGLLTWENLAAKLGYWSANPVEVQWAVFDNGTGSRTAIPQANTPYVPQILSGYSVATVVSLNNRLHKVDVFVHHEGVHARVVGIERHWK